MDRGNLVQVQLRFQNFNDDPQPEAVEPLESQIMQVGSYAPYPGYVEPSLAPAEEAQPVKETIISIPESRPVDSSTFGEKIGNETTLYL